MREIRPNGPLYWPQADPVRIDQKVRLPMILERLTAWTLVIVYYTVTCGAILLGLKGAL